MYTTTTEGTSMVINTEEVASRIITHVRKYGNGIFHIHDGHDAGIAQGYIVDDKRFILELRTTTPDAILETSIANFIDTLPIHRVTEINTYVEILIRGDELWIGLIDVYLNKWAAVAMAFNRGIYEIWDSAAQQHMQIQGGLGYGAL
jgi:hypothetical protein